MEKSKKFPQLSILAAGTFANIVFTVIFALILLIFFLTAFTPVGVNYLNIYPTKTVNLSDISNLDQINDLNDLDFAEVKVGRENYLTSAKVLKATIDHDLNEVFIFENTPAFEARLAGDPLTERPRIAGAITEINGQKILSSADLQREIYGYKEGDTITINTIQKPLNAKNSFSNLFVGDEKEFTLTISEREGTPFIGVFLVPSDARRSGLLSSAYSFITAIKDPQIYYISPIKELGIFIYDLLWWITLISISVALVNMLPLGIFDGGRFFYLTIWGLTGSKKIGEKAFKSSTIIFLLLIAALMVRWLLIFV